MYFLNYKEGTKCFSTLHTKYLLQINKIFGKCQKDNENLSVLSNSFWEKIYNIYEAFSSIFWKVLRGHWLFITFLPKFGEDFCVFWDQVHFEKELKSSNVYLELQKLSHYELCVSLSPLPKQAHDFCLSSSSPNLKYISSRLWRYCVASLPHQLIKRWVDYLFILIFFGKSDTYFSTDLPFSLLIYMCTLVFSSYHAHNYSSGSHYHSFQPVKWPGTQYSVSFSYKTVKRRV